jgi:hypothetical protein
MTAATYTLLVVSFWLWRICKLHTLLNNFTRLKFYNNFKTTDSNNYKFALKRLLVPNLMSL